MFWGIRVADDTDTEPNLVEAQRCRNRKEVKEKVQLHACTSPRLYLDLQIHSPAGGRRCGGEGGAGGGRGGHSFLFSLFFSFFLLFFFLLFFVHG